MESDEFVPKVRHLPLDAQVDEIRSWGSWLLKMRACQIKWSPDYKYHLDTLHPGSHRIIKVRPNRELGDEYVGEELADYIHRE